MIKKYLMPVWLKAEQFVLRLLYTGRGRYCPVCERTSRKFGTYGVEKREDAQCMSCGALERHRLIWLFLNRKTDLLTGKSKKMLHVAPEPIFEKLFKKHLSEGYLTADLFITGQMV